MITQQPPEGLAVAEYKLLTRHATSRQPRLPGFWPEGMRCCVLFGIAELSLDDFSRCAVAHLYYVNAGLQGIAAATVEVVDGCDVRIAHALGSDCFDAGHVVVYEEELLPLCCFLICRR